MGQNCAKSVQDIKRSAFSPEKISAGLSKLIVFFIKFKDKIFISASFFTNKLYYFKLNNFYFYIFSLKF